MTRCFRCGTVCERASVFCAVCATELDGTVGNGVARTLVEGFARFVRWINTGGGQA